MKEIANKRKYIISLSITIIGVLALISGTSYAILSGNSVSKSEHVIKAGSVELLLTENYDSIDNPISQMENADGLLQEKAYEFNIRNIGSVSAKYDLKLEATGVNSIDAEYIKVGLEVNGKEIGPMKLSKVNNIIDSSVINKNEIIRYKMRLWIDNLQDNNLTNESVASFKLGVNAKQGDGKQELVYYAFETPTIESTTDYKQLEKSVFAALKGEQKSICILANEKLECLANNDFDIEKNHIQEVFGSTTCDVKDTYVECSNASFSCRVSDDGKVKCTSIITKDNCELNALGVVSCSSNQ